MKNLRKICKIAKIAKIAKLAKFCKIFIEKWRKFMRILRKSCRFLKILQNEPLIAKFGVDTAEKCTIENSPPVAGGGRRAEAHAPTPSPPSYLCRPPCCCSATRCKARFQSCISRLYRRQIYCFWCHFLAFFEIYTLNSGFSEILQKN